MTYSANLKLLTFKGFFNNLIIKILFTPPYGGSFVQIPLGAITPLTVIYIIFLEFYQGLC